MATKLLKDGEEGKGIMDLIRALIIIFVSFLLLVVIGQVIGKFWFFVVLVFGAVAFYEGWRQ